MVSLGGGGQIVEEGWEKRSKILGEAICSGNPEHWKKRSRSDRAALSALKITARKVRKGRGES